jgi:hypothetical protein
MEVAGQHHVTAALALIDWVGSRGCLKVWKNVYILSSGIRTQDRPARSLLTINSTLLRLVSYEMTQHKNSSSLIILEILRYTTKVLNIQKVYLISSTDFDHDNIKTTAILWGSLREI